MATYTFWCQIWSHFVNGEKCWHFGWEQNWNKPSTVALPAGQVRRYNTQKRCYSQNFSSLLLTAFCLFSFPITDLTSRPVFLIIDLATAFFETKIDLSRSMQAAAFYFEEAWINKCGLSKNISANLEFFGSSLLKCNGLFQNNSQAQTCPWSQQAGIGRRKPCCHLNIMSKTKNRWKTNSS